MENQRQRCAGLLCTEPNLLERYVPLINRIRTLQLKALWCPDAEKSIHFAAAFDVPSVSHTASQLLSRSDIGTVIVAGHPGHKIDFCVQAQAMRKEVICIGCLAVTVRSAQILDEFTSRLKFPPINTLYPLKYCKPVCLLRLNAEQLGSLHTVTVDFCFQKFDDDKDRLLYDASILLHMFGHELIDAVASICKFVPQPNATTYHTKTSIVQHFRLKELDSAHLQVVFGNTVANLRIVASESDSLAIRVHGTEGILELDESGLRLIRFNQSSLLWEGSRSIESIFTDGLVNALSAETFIEGPSELSLVRCIESKVCC